jgi:hypothetical protein
MGKAFRKEPVEPTEGVAGLARLFPGVVPLRIPVHVSKGDAAGEDGREKTVIEFGTAEEILFVSRLPLDFDDTVRVRNLDGSLDVTAQIVAMRLHRSKMAFAARFLGEVANWIVKAQPDARAEND